MDRFNRMDFKPNLRNTFWKNGWKNMPECYVQIKTPGVTSVINSMIPNPEIDEWIKEVGKETADNITQAANYRGTAMHLFIENYLIEMKKSGDPSAALRFTQITTPEMLVEEDKSMPQRKIDEGRDLFYKFQDCDYSSKYDRLIRSEMNIYSHKLFYRGRVDWTYNRKESGLAISDFKTSSKPIESGSRKEEGYKYQLGGYGLAFDHMLEADGKSQRVNYASIISVHTKSNLVQNIYLEGVKFQEYKDKFAEIVSKWHRQNGQGFLIQ